MYLPKLFAKASPKAIQFWLFLSLALSLSYSGLALKEALSGSYIVQDDARQHVFWMLRFVDPSLFPNDLIADYFQSVAPAGYTALYQSAIFLGIDPLLLNKLLPTLLGLVLTAYNFGLSLEIFPLPVAGFITTLVFNQNMWFKDDLISATPRAFAYPLMLAFLYYLVRGVLWQTLGAIALLGLFYPQAVLICAAILVLRLFDWENRRLHLSPVRRNWIFCIVGLSVVFVILLPFALSSSEYGPAITVAEAKTLPEFWPNGRSSFFRDTPWDFYLFSNRSGMFPRSLFTPVTLCAGLLLPLFLLFAKRFPLMRQITTHIHILPQILIASIALFFMAHAALFKLHLPSRYTGISFRITIAIATGIALTLILDILWRWINSPQTQRRVLAWGGIGIIAIALIGYPLFVDSFPKTSYKKGTIPALYQFFQQQPKDIVIASISEEANNFPTFSQRSIFVGREYAIPYQIGYYRIFRQRLEDLVRALYSPNVADLQQFLTQYRVDFFYLDVNSLTLEYLTQQRWIRELQSGKELTSQIQQGAVPALATLIPQCQVFEIQGSIVLNAQCLLNQTQSQNSAN